MNVLGIYVWPVSVPSLLISTCPSAMDHFPQYGFLQSLVLLGVNLSRILHGGYIV